MEFNPSIITQQILKNKQNTPDKPAIIYNNEPISYNELCKSFLNLAQILLDEGIKYQDRILVILGNEPLSLISLLAIAYIGAIFIPIDKKTPDLEIIKKIKILDCNLIISSKNSKKNIALNHPIKFINSDKLNLSNEVDKVEVPYHVSNDAGFIYCLTSGTTGTPKAIILNQNTKIKRVQSAKQSYHLNKNITTIISTPFHHSLGIRLFLIPVILGGTCVLQESYTAKSWALLVKKYNVNFSILVSKQISDISKNPIPKTIKTLVSSSSKLTDKIKEDLNKNSSCEIHEIYGASEVGVISNLNISKENKKIASVGKPLPETDVKIINKANQELPPNEIGEIICKSDTQFSGYFRAGKSHQNNNEYFYTSDLGYLDSDGYLYFTGRKIDTISLGGLNIYPYELENTILTTNLVSEVAVVGIKDNEFNTVIAAFIVPNHNFTDIKSFRMELSKKIINYKQPSIIHILTELPKNFLGKVQKHKLFSIPANSYTLDLRKLISNLL